MISIKVMVAEGWQKVQYQFYNPIIMVQVIAVTIFIKVVEA